MILFVIKAFKKDKDLLSDYQEKFLYILVDEYQDSNSAQNKILELLSSYDSSPNLFVVGDDDQSIFRFQGAAIENLLEFQKNYHPQLIVLKNNYRSHQLILDSSLSVVSHNQNRLSHLLKDVDKTLISQKKYDPDPINLFVANTHLEEHYYVAKKIKKLINAGTDPRFIAILYRTNKDPDSLIPFLKNLSISYQISSGDNILTQTHIKNLLKLFKFLQNPSLDRLLFDLLSSSFVNLDPFDLLKLFRLSYQKHLPLFDLIQKPTQLDIKSTSQKKLKTFLKHLSLSLQDINSLSFDRAFNSIIRRFNYLDSLLKKDDIKVINQLNHFYTFIKKLSDQKFTLPQILSRLDLLDQNNISIVATNFDQDLQAINLLTVHKAKGLEFDHVFIINLVDKKWGNSRNSSPLKLPHGIINSETLTVISDQNEDARRLFYVALTRAKKQIYLSYSQTAHNGRQLIPSIFLSEIKPQLIETVKPDKFIKSFAVKNRFTRKTPPLLSKSVNRNYLKNYLANHYRLNVTHLNSYLACPLCFYYKTILRLPDTKDKNLSFGTAVHFALTYLYNQLKLGKPLISQNRFLKIFKSALTRENLSKKDFQDVLAIAKLNLPDYYHQYQSSFSADCLSEYDFAVSKVFVNDTPITGKIDRIQPTKGSTKNLPNAQVFDYKTGRPDHKNLGRNGDYFRQLVFYKILADNSPNFPFHIATGTIDFIQKNKQSQFIQKDYHFAKQDILTVIDLIEKTYQNILNLEFNHIGTNCRDRQSLHRLLE